MSRTLKLKTNRQEIHKFLTLLDSDISGMFFEGAKTNNSAFFNFEIIESAIKYLLDCRLEYKERWYLRGLKMIIKKYEIESLYEYINIINKKLNEHNVIRQKGFYYCPFRKVIIYDEIELSKKGINMKNGELVYDNRN